MLAHVALIYNIHQRYVVNCNFMPNSIAVNRYVDLCKLLQANNSHSMSTTAMVPLFLGQQQIN
jgi:hypothetical protein